MASTILTHDRRGNQGDVGAEGSAADPVYAWRAGRRDAADVARARDDHVVVRAVVARPDRADHRLDRVRRVPGQGERLRAVVDRVRALGVLDAAEVPLHPDADAVVLVRQLQPAGRVVVERPDLPGHAREVLQAPVLGLEGAVARDLRDADLPVALERRAARHDRQRYRLRRPDARVYVHWKVFRRVVCFNGKVRGRPRRENHLLWLPMFIPQIEGTGLPPDTMN